MSLDVLRVLAKTKGRPITTFSRLQPPSTTTRKHDLYATGAALSAFISHGREVVVRCRTTIPDAACKLLAKRLGKCQEENFIIRVRF